VFGYLPIALAIGAGSQSRTSMGIVVIGGLIFATILTLYVIPMIYTYVSSEEQTVTNVTIEGEAVRRKSEEMVEV
jgi:multidrug efflux pump